ncbi:PAP2 superfamily protein [Halalkalicoccus paucihalophilus]|uniref:PAP2 superfamily protein n=2 Tax=Halalkalicoccus paucihalophilus TaxID=1008153 RepID=A0A151A9C8_9EURY|nr:PAP2 superfamily protein [Halalkalicoccus paucihalophilus]
MPNHLFGQIQRYSCGIGITELLYGQAPWQVIVLFAVISQLGDVWFLFLLGGSLYIAGRHFPWCGVERRRGLFVFGLVLIYISLIGVLKNVFMLPRPPGATTSLTVPGLPILFSAVIAAITTAHGFGFPSGHALGTTLVWGGFALVLDRKSNHARFGVAGAVIFLVSLARLVLGVHYPVDVLAGIGIGILSLGILYRLTDDGTAPTRLLFLAVVIGFVGLVINPSVESVAALGGALGGWTVWRTVADLTSAHPADRREVTVGFAMLALAAGFVGGIYALRLSYIVTFLGAVVAVGTIVATPLLSEKLT